VLSALPLIPFNVGKTGLIKILAGSITASIKEDRMPLFGALGAWSQGRIDALIERLIADGMIARGDSEYRPLSLTPAGQGAGPGELAAYAAPQRAAHTAAVATLTTGTARPLTEDGDNDVDPLDAASAALLERLKAWRSAEARARAVPPYIIAKDALLRDVALQLPATPEELQAIKGFGPAKVDTFGEAILALVNDG